MGGGLLQLVAYGAQDVYLTGSPQITFFRVVYRRYTSFAIESIANTINGTVGWGKKVSVTVSRNGDLVQNVYIEIQLKKSGTTWYPAEAVLSQVELEIGGQRIDRVYSDWLRIYDELFRRDDKKAVYKRLVDFHPNDPVGTVKRFYVPLNFFFTGQTPVGGGNAGLALPLLALQFHEVRITITFAEASAVAGVNSDTLSADVYIDYIYLDTEERRRVAQQSTEMLITQVQYTGDESVTIDTSTRKSQNVRLNFNHPTSLLAWVVKGSTHGVYSAADLANAGTTQEAYAPLYSARLQLNGSDRFSERYGSYFNKVQPFQHLGASPAAGIYAYSFALKPDEPAQPSGSLNLSRIDTATLALTFKAASVANVANVLDEATTLAAAASLNKLSVYAVNYNVLRILSGMGGLAYSS